MSVTCDALGASILAIITRTEVTLVSTRARRPTEQWSNARSEALTFHLHLESAVFITGTAGPKQPECLTSTPTRTNFFSSRRVCRPTTNHPNRTGQISAAYLIGVVGSADQLRSLNFDDRHHPAQRNHGRRQRTGCGAGRRHVQIAPRPFIAESDYKCAFGLDPGTLAYK